VKINSILSLLLILIITSCAKQARPPGGPVDKTPPFVVQATPTPGALNVDTLTDVEVIFSEGINPSSAKDAIFITPFQGDNVRLHFRGRKIAVKFKNPLDLNRTYVITFGTGISDYRSNKMDSSFTLAFSTGPVLDNGEIHGRVADVGQQKGVDVWAYQIKVRDPDPSLVSPDYIVQCSAGGSFKFNHISPGKYRVFAVKDRAADKLYQPVEDEIGVSFKDAVITRDSLSICRDILIKMAYADTAGPELVRAKAVNSTRVVFQFSEPVDYSSGRILITPENRDNDSLSIRFLWQCRNQKQVLYAETDKQEKVKYNVQISDIFDDFGNNIDTAFSSAVFSGSSGPDTISPEISITVPQPGEKDVNISTNIFTGFSEPVDTSGAQNSIVLCDTLGHTVHGTLEWLSSCEAIFKPLKSLSSNKIYLIEISGPPVKDIYGNFIADTTISFTTVNTDTLGEISGKIIDPEQNAEGKIFICARKINTPEREYSTSIDEPGDFRFLNVMPGKYKFFVFRDSDKNSTYTFGSPFPYEPSERFVTTLDTVVVKPRWRNEGNHIILPSNKN